MSFTCKHFLNEHCLLLDKPCEPGMKGCTLYGKFVFSNPETPSNKAIEKKKKKKNNQQDFKSL